MRHLHRGFWLGYSVWGRGQLPTPRRCEPKNAIDAEALGLRIPSVEAIELFLRSAPNIFMRILLQLDYDLHSRSSKRNVSAFVINHMSFRLCCGLACNHVWSQQIQKGIPTGFFRARGCRAGP